VIWPASRKTWVLFTWGNPFCSRQASEAAGICPRAIGAKDFSAQGVNQKCAAAASRPQNLYERLPPSCLVQGTLTDAWRAQQKIKEFERMFQAGRANLKRPAAPKWAPQGKAIFYRCAVQQLDSMYVRVLNHPRHVRGPD
jgi:hypothetical protein